MKGEIVIKTTGIGDVTVAVKTTPLHKLEKLILIDALCESLRIDGDDDERAVIGLTIATGGLKAVSGIPSEQFAIDVTALKKELKKDKSEATEA